ncbi:zinc-dependent alcohol dehydrogenase [Microbacterium pygmaeum]|uniref:zinc-dependent alcohol dehydrogenase n=1 Tax=Microbacterium pygmaeum TaxID=370764 RepID=UPI0015613D8B|nr:alcohol dehydrogenase catalytic domain-containing protein [Microbacterium pygmaeum]
MTTQSRQVVFSAPNEIAIDSIAVPDPGPDDVIVRVRRVGVCATDLHLLAGHIGDTFPLVPGHEFVGEVAAIGAAAAESHGLGIGDHVAVEMLLPCHRCPRCLEGTYNLCERDDMATGLSRGRQLGVNIPRTVAPGLWGGYSEYLYVPAEAIVHRLPADLPWDVAVLVEPFAVACRAVQRGRVGPGDRVLVIGPGPIGILLAAAARSAGASVVVLGTRDSRLRTARAFGADATINMREQDAETMVRAHVGALADVVIEAAGSSEAQQLAARLVRRGGRVVLAGACGAGSTTSFRSDEDLLTREIDVLPSFLSAGGFGSAIGLLERGDFPYADLITHSFPLDEVAAAFAVIAHREQDVMKVVLLPTGP